MLQLEQSQASILAKHVVQQITKKKKDQHEISLDSTTGEKDHPDNIYNRTSDTMLPTLRHPQKTTVQMGEHGKHHQQQYRVNNMLLQHPLALGA